MRSCGEEKEKGRQTESGERQIDIAQATQIKHRNSSKTDKHTHQWRPCQQATPAINHRGPSHCRICTATDYLTETPPPPPMPSLSISVSKTQDEKPQTKSDRKPGYHFPALLPVSLLHLYRSLIKMIVVSSVSGCHSLVVSAEQAPPQRGGV
ncbi:hypothetical protein BKA81DRAFT_91729 [Phyllosticta paracitricarpa]